MKCIMEAREEKRVIKGFARTHAAQPLGAGAEIITIEADVTRGLHSMSIIGLPDKAVEEARDRIVSAIRHAHLPSPKTKNERITLSLSPADTKKEGAQYDLALTVCYLSAVGILQEKNHEKRIFLGELSLDGSVRAVRGVLPSVIAAQQAGFTEAFVPKQNIGEATLVPDITIYGISSLQEILTHFGYKTENKKEERRELKSATSMEVKEISLPQVDIADIKGQESAKRALIIAAAGKHNIAFYGPPGTGKTLLAKALPGILPPLEKEEALSVTAIHSTAGSLPQGTWISTPPFRAPHHSASHVALIGGGSFPRAGEITLAHGGVLFLDEFPEFESRTIEALREPLEERVVRISRARGTVLFPADILLVVAMNPPDEVAQTGALRERDRLRFARKVSQPIMDRIDLWVHVPKVPKEILTAPTTGQSSQEIQQTISELRIRQKERQACENGRLPSKNIENETRTTPEALALLGSAIDRINLSPRAYHRVLRVARTIADIEKSDAVDITHVTEALQYRPRNLI